MTSHFSLLFGFTVIVKSISQTAPWASGGEEKTSSTKRRRTLYGRAVVGVRKAIKCGDFVKISTLFLIIILNQYFKSLERI